MCGADGPASPRISISLGSSPRVRSGPTVATGCDRTTGIISACAERTTRTPIPRNSNWDHLRVCGADRDRQEARAGIPGSSPRVRSGHLPRMGGYISDGIISACAERTVAEELESICNRDHLRVCGADLLQS